MRGRSQRRSQGRGQSLQQQGGRGFLQTFGM
jgi:hypothetical protein